MRPSTDLLTPATTAAYLVRRGLVKDPSSVRVRPLGGGVSNIVLAVDTDKRQLVIKQSLGQLRVSDEWLAPRDRLITESEGLQLARQLTPEATPSVVDCDADRCIMVIERAPTDWTDWKTQLMTLGPSAVDQDIARRLGVLLATWQNAPAAGLSRRFTDPAAFEALRIDPYYRAVARRRPDERDAVQAYVDRLLSRRLCFSHGDFSPKNVLVGQDGLWVIDFEVAHLGDPAFDVAFLLSHLLLKSLHSPDRTMGFAACADAFVTSYEATVDPALLPAWDYVAGHVGCLLLARVDGKSPAEYLSPAQRTSAQRLGAALLTEPPGRPTQMWTLRTALEEHV